MSALFVFRNDLRLFDNPALHHALSNNPNAALVYIYDEDVLNLGGASKWWLHNSLASLTREIEGLGGKLNIFTGKTEVVIQELVSKHNFHKVYWNRRYEPNLINLDKKIKESLKSQHIDVETSNGYLLFEPFEVQSATTKKPFQVFTPFWKRCLELGLERTIHPKPTKLAPHDLSSLSLDTLDLLPTKPDWAGGMRDEWQPGEEGSMKRFDSFLERAAHNYKDERNIPGIEGTSKLSPHLHFGEISVAYIAKRCQEALAQDSRLERGITHFLSELGWREFSYHLLYHIDNFETEPLRKEFLRFPWQNNPEQLKAWQKGRTGYPIIDAGMRQLWETGWMHNRVRMIVASFLVKDLFIHWHEGAKWFWDTLVDADLANNSASWQWVSGCGADAAPYFRIFNPILQGEKFDPDGNYIRKYVPELASLPNQYIHAPWTAPEMLLRQAGIKLGITYPRPIVDHDVMRKKALELYQGLKE